MRRPSSNNKISKTAVISIRMTPRDKYFLDLVARRDQKSSTAVAIEEVLKKFIEEHEMSQRSRTLDVMEKDDKLVDIEILGDSLFDTLWSVNPGIRLFKLHRHAPSLMSQEDECIYKKIRAEVIFWTDQEMRKPNFLLIRKAWSILDEYGELAVDDPDTELDMSRIQKILDDLDEEIGNEIEQSSRLSPQRKRSRNNEGVSDD